MLLEHRTRTQIPRGLTFKGYSRHASLNARFSAREQQLHDGAQEKIQLVQDLKSVKAQLNACEKEVVAAKQSLDQCKTDAANEVQKEQERCQKRVDALQAHLAQTKAEMQAQVSQEHGQNDCPQRMR